MNTPSLKGQVHEEIEKIFRTLLPRNGLAVREEQVTLCHIMLDALLKNNIALCDAGVGIGKTYAYLTGCILLRKNAPHRWRCSCTGESSIKKGSRESIKSGNEFGVFACSKKVLNYNWCEKLKDCKKGVILS